MNRLFAFAALAFLVAFTSCGLLENDDISDPIKDYGDFELQENVIFMTNSLDDYIISRRLHIQAIC